MFISRERKEKENPEKTITSRRFSLIRAITKPRNCKGLRNNVLQEIQTRTWSWKFMKRKSVYKVSNWLSNDIPTILIQHENFSSKVMTKSDTDLSWCNIYSNPLLDNGLAENLEDILHTAVGTALLETVQMCLPSEGVVRIHCSHRQITSFLIVLYLTSENFNLSNSWRRETKNRLEQENND